MQNLHQMTDVLKAKLTVDQDHLLTLMTPLSDHQRGYAKCAALTCSNPCEIRLHWVRDPQDSDAWLQLRTYFELYEIAPESSDSAPANSMNVFVMVRFAWIQNAWTLHDLIIEELGYGAENQQLATQLNETYRTGELVYERTSSI